MKCGSFIIFSSDDWGWKTSKYQVSIRLARDNTVLFISSVGFRPPTASRGDLGRIFRKVKDFLRGVRQVEPNLYVLTPLIIPFWRGGYVERLNVGLLAVQIAWARVRLKIADPYLLVFSQNWHDLVVRQKRRKLVYYCVDDHSGFSGLNAQSFQKKDEALTQVADLVLCSSRLLYERKREVCGRVEYLPHGVDYHHFSRAVLDPALQPPPETAPLKRPVVGFFGHISYDWVDVDLLKRLAKSRPSWTVLLIGRYSIAEDEFASFPNVVYVGEKDFAELPAYCKAMDVGLIPFLKSRLTDHCNPLKLYEYLAAGLPVVSTDIPEVSYFKDRVRIAGDAELFIDACDAAVAEGEVPRKARSVAMAGFSWDRRVETICMLLREGNRVSA
ncbi:glycosyltransferase [Geomonas sp. RF6]|uniref:glycosyltransferase n=1 Tax=Geomonas sp. RF6 TaxID=2897342 RepID=UPI001E442066|nr:glycosyltransferase [Geomonas sp. RF6]UFS69109.1 glycosyltransferase [Geomonas sp. RF6]